MWIFFFYSARRSFDGCEYNHHDNNDKEEEVGVKYTWNNGKGKLAHTKKKFDKVICNSK